MKKQILVLLFTLFTSVAFGTEKEQPSKLDEVLAKSVEKAISVAEKTGQFVIEQAPDLLKQFYMWHIAECIFWIVFSIGLFILGRYLPYAWLSKEESEYDSRFFGRYGNDEIPLAYILFILSTLLSIIIFLTSIYELLFITIAPKLYLIEYFIG